jgi:hypothetical protein
MSPKFENENTSARHVFASDMTWANETQPSLTDQGKEQTANWLYKPLI